MRLLDRLQLRGHLIDIVLSDSDEVEVQSYPPLSTEERSLARNYLSDEGIMARANENASICRSAGA